MFRRKDSKVCTNTARNRHGILFWKFLTCLPRNFLENTEKTHAWFFCFPLLSNQWLTINYVNKRQCFFLPPVLQTNPCPKQVIPKGRKTFKGWGKFTNLWYSDIWKMHLRIKKVNLDIFTHASHAKLPQVLFITQRQREINDSPLCRVFLENLSS